MIPDPNGGGNIAAIGEAGDDQMQKYAAQNPIATLLP